jgi:Spy/CpxP family protein refolding chaperone
VLGGSSESRAKEEGESMKPRWGIVLMGVVAVGLWTATASANGMGPWPRGGRGMLPLLLRGVGLSEAQQAQVRQIVAAHRPQFRALHDQLRVAHGELAEKLYGSAPVAAADLDPLLERLSQLRRQLAQEGLQVALEVRGILTPEQLAKAAQIRQRLNELRAEMRNLVGKDR